MKKTLIPNSTKIKHLLSFITASLKITSRSEKDSKIKKSFFQSDTDSEVIAQLIAYHYQGKLRPAVAKAMRELQGSFAIAVIHIDHPHEIIAASRESPLVLGLDLSLIGMLVISPQTLTLLAANHYK